MGKKSLLASFGIRALEVLRAVKAGRRLDQATIDTLISVGWAVLQNDGTVVLTVAGNSALEMLEKLEAIPEEHVDGLERMADPATQAEANEVAAIQKPPGSKLFGAPK